MAFEFHVAGPDAVVALLVGGWGQIQSQVPPDKLRVVLFGAFMGTGAIATMVISAEFQPGMHVDPRSTLLVASSLFGEPLAAALTTGMALAWPLGIGGTGGLDATSAAPTTSPSLTAALHISYDIGVMTSVS